MIRKGEKSEVDYLKKRTKGTRKIRESVRKNKTSSTHAWEMK